MGHPEELAAAAERVVLAIHELEECWRRDTLGLPLASVRLQASVGRGLLEPYKAVSFSPEEVLWPHRQVWMQRVLGEFSMVCGHANFSFSAAVVSDAPEKFAVMQENELVILRADQVFGARFWHIGIKLDLSKEAVWLANDILARAASNLLSDILNINKLCRHHAEKRIYRPDQIQWPISGRGIEFERLIADILNETELTARHASLWEDLFEWTDLRVSYPDLQRNNGARVQVKLVGKEAVQNERIRHKREREFYVVVSPVQMARYAAKCLETGPKELVGDEFWECVNGTPADTNELALILERTFLAAMETGEPHPYGPMARIPGVVRRLIRAYVREGAFASTDLIRRETNEHPANLPRWRRF